MTDACGTQGSVNASSSTNVIVYEGCVEASCDCVVLIGGVRAVSSSTTVSARVNIGVGAVVETLDAPAWAAAVVAGADLLITGVAPVGAFTLVYDISNECSKECLVVKVTVTGQCAPPVDIVRNIGYVNNSFSISTEVPIPIDSVFVSGTIPDARYTVYAQDLTITAALQQPLPTTYSISMATPCGPYTISGSLVECKVPRLIRVVGGSVFEVGVSYAMSWVVEATAALSFASQEGVPLGGTLTLLQDTPSIGFATVTLTGTPSENTGAGEIKFTLRGQCGSLSQARKFSQQGCRALQVVGQTGNSQFAVSGTTPVNFCKVVRGYEPSIAEFTGVPLGLNVTVAPAATAGDWLVCITGVVEVDPCVKPETGSTQLCKCAEIKVKNDCGVLDIKLCYNVDLVTTTPKPQYCIGAYDYDPVTSKVRIWGVVPFSTVTIATENGASNAGDILQTFNVDATGFGEFVLIYSLFPGKCVKISHPICALVNRGFAKIYCQPVVVPTDGN